MNTPLFRKLNLEAYKPGRSFLNKKKSIIKLSANESALGMSKNANKAIIKSKNNKKVLHMLNFYEKIELMMHH